MDGGTAGMIGIIQYMARASYELRILGNLGPSWADWIGQGEFRRDGETSVLTLREVDHSTLYGVLGILGDLDLAILELRRLP